MRLETKRWRTQVSLTWVAAMCGHIGCGSTDPGASETGSGMGNEEDSSGSEGSTSDGPDDDSDAQDEESTSSGGGTSTSTGTTTSATTTSSEGGTSTTTSGESTGNPSTTTGETGDTASASETGGDGELRWVGTWGSGQQSLVDAAHMPPVSLANNTVRQFIYTSIGGDELRLQLSNEYGNGPLTVNSVHLALPTNAPSIDPSTDTPLTFSGAASVTLQPGEFLYSDTVAFSLPEQSSVAVSIHFGAVPSTITGHPGSRSNSYIAYGDAASAATYEFPQVNHQDSGGTGAGNPGQGWYFTTRLEVMAPMTSHAVVTFGDSLTDGRGSTTDGNDRWPDVLSRRLRMNPGTESVAVINAGMGGNGLVADNGGGRPTGVARFERDALTQEGVRWVIVLMGVNDIGYSGQSAAQVIAGYEQMIDAAHAADLLIYGVPLLPFGGWGQATNDPGLFGVRDTINDWVRTSGRFDAVIELDAAVADPQDATRLSAQFNSDDLHPNANGYRAMGDAVPLTLFAE